MPYNKISYDSIPHEWVIYIIKIKDKDIYKIGRSSKIKYRIRNLRVSIYEDFEFDVIKMCCRESSIKKERYIKEKLQEFRINKSEWFKCNSDVIESLKQKIITDY